MMTDIQDYSGWRFASAFAIPGAVAARSDGEAPIRVVGAPVAAGTGPGGHPAWQADGDGGIRLLLPGIGRFRMRDGDRVEVEPEKCADPVTIGLLLSGPVLAVLVRQRGLLPLDGAALAWKGGALLVAGPSGEGKSTLAASLARRGWPVLGDGILPVQCGGASMLSRGWPRLRLWGRAAEALGVAVAGLSPLRPDVARFDTLWPAGEGAAPWPVSGILLVMNRTARPSCAPLRPGRAVACLTQSLWSRPAYAEGARAQSLLAELSALAHGVPCWLMRPGEDLANLGATADLVAAELDQQAGR